MPSILRVRREHPGIVLAGGYLLATMWMLGTPCLLVLGSAGNGIRALRKLGKCSIMESLHPTIVTGGTQSEPSCTPSSSHTYPDRIA